MVVGQCLYFISWQMAAQCCMGWNCSAPPQCRISSHLTLCHNGNDENLITGVNFRTWKLSYWFLCVIIGIVILQFWSWGNFHILKKVVCAWSDYITRNDALGLIKEMLLAAACSSSIFLFWNLNTDCRCVVCIIILMSCFVPKGAIKWILSNVPWNWNFSTSI